MAAPGPTLPTWALQQVVGYLGYTGRDANVVAEAALAPLPTCGVDSENEIYGGIAGLLRLDTSELDHLAPLLGFGGDELAEIGGRTWEHRGAQVGKPRLHLGVGEGRVDLTIQLADDLRGCVLGSAQAECSARLVAGYKLADRRNVW